MATDPDEIRKFVRRLIQQPYNAIRIHPMLFGDHKPLVDREIWILSQIELLRQVGPAEYFKGLLEALENPLTNEEFSKLSADDAVSIINRTGVPSPYQTGQ